VKDSAVRLREISIARDTLQLAPGLTAGVPIRTDVAASEPAMIGAIVIRTEVLRGVDGASAPSGEGEESRWRPCRLGAGIAALRTGLAERFVDESGKGLRLFGACASALGGYEGQLGHGEWLVGQPDMDKETDEDESHHEELVKQRIRRHDAVLCHGGERGPLYCIRPLLNYPLHSHTRPPFPLSPTFKG
jgi:hypothetical protein